MWLVGVVIRRYIDILIIIINFPYSTCIRSFFGSSILTSLFILKIFFWPCNILFEALKLIRLIYGILYLSKIAHALRKHVTESIRNIARVVGIN